MSSFRTLLNLGGAAALAFTLAACADDPTVDPSGAAGAGAGAGAYGSLDPSSVAYFQQTIGDKVFFETDSSSLTSAAQATLREQARWLMSNASATAVIEGHADERGTREYNLALGARRAAAARNFLVAEGVSADRLRSVTFGKERPEATCSAENCWAQNRRAVSVIAGAPTS